MSFSTEDCKRLLSADAELVALGLGGANWKRKSKKNGPLGTERVFVCSTPFSYCAKVCEQGDQLQVASVGAEEDRLDDPALLREPLLGSVQSPSSLDKQQSPFFWETYARCSKKTDLKLAKQLIDALLQDEEELDMNDDEGSTLNVREAIEEAQPSSSLGLALANQFVFYFAQYDDEDFVFTLPRSSLDADDGGEDGIEFPIGHLIPDEEAEDPNGGGGWLLINGQGRTPAQIVEDMTDQGFEFSMSLQKEIAPDAYEQHLAPLFLAMTEQRLLQEQDAQRSGQSSAASITQTRQQRPLRVVRRESVFKTSTLFSCSHARRTQSGGGEKWQ